MSNNDNLDLDVDLDVTLSQNDTSVDDSTNTSWPDDTEEEKPSIQTAFPIDTDFEGEGMFLGEDEEDDYSEDENEESLETELSETREPVFIQKQDNQSVAKFNEKTGGNELV